MRFSGDFALHFIWCYAYVYIAGCSSKIEYEVTYTDCWRKEKSVG